MIAYFNSPKLYQIANEIIGRSQDGFGCQKIEILHIALLFHYLRRHNALAQYTDNFVLGRWRIIPYPQDIIDKSFYWDNTPQGHEFWSAAVPFSRVILDFFQDIPQIKVK